MGGQDFLVLGDGAIDVRDYDLVVPVPQVDGALTATRPLVLSGNAEGDIIWPVSQLQAGLEETENQFKSIHRSSMALTMDKRIKIDAA